MTPSRDLEKSDDRLALEESRSCAPSEDLPLLPPKKGPLPPVKDRKKYYVIISLIYANFWMAASFSLQSPFFPREAELKGATPTQYGFVFSVFELVVIIMSPIYGKLIPRITPKFLITSGVLIGGLACCAFGCLDFVPAGNWYISLAFVVRIFEGFGAASLMTASFTIIAATFPDSVATTFSWMETAFGLGLIVGPTIGGALYQIPMQLFWKTSGDLNDIQRYNDAYDEIKNGISLRRAAETHSINYRSLYRYKRKIDAANDDNTAENVTMAGGFVLPFVVTGVLLLLGCVVLFFLLPHTEAERPSGSRNLFGFLFDGAIASYTFAIITSMIYINFNSATLEPHLRQFNLQPVVLGVIFVITGGMYAITTPLWGKICDKGVNPLYVNMLGSILTCVGLLFLAPVPFLPIHSSLGLVIGSLVVAGFGLSAKLVASFVGALKDTIRRGFPDSLATYGMVSALFSTASSTGAFIGPSLGGLLLDTTGYRMGTVVILGIEMAFLLGITSYVILLAVRKKKDKDLKDDFDRKSLLTHSYTRRSYSYTSI